MKTNEIVITNLEGLAEEIKAEHLSAIQSMRKGLEHALKVGDLLLLARDLVQHGEWEKWVTENCEFTPRMARNYMNVSRKKNILESETISEMTLRDAMVRVDMSSREEAARTRTREKIEKEKRLRLENEDRQVKDYLDAVSEFRKDFDSVLSKLKRATREANEAAEFGKFSPEAKRYTIRRIDEARRTIDKADLFRGDLLDLEATLDDKKYFSWIKDEEIALAMRVFRNFSNMIDRLKNTKNEPDSARKLLEQFRGYLRIFDEKIDEVLNEPIP